MLIDTAQAMLTNLQVQGIGVLTGLQDKFSWSSVAVAGVTTFTAGMVSRGLSQMNISGIANTIISTTAAGISSAGTRSLMTGTSFGDNIMAVLPNVIGQSAGSAFAQASGFNLVDIVMRARTGDPDWNQSETLFESLRMNGRAEGASGSIAGNPYVNEFSVLPDGPLFDPIDVFGGIGLNEQRASAAVQGGEALRRLIAAANPSQRAALEAGLTGSVRSNRMGGGSPSGTAQWTEGAGTIPAAPTDPDASLAGGINFFAHFWKGGQASLKDWLYNSHNGYFDGSDASANNLIGRISRDTAGNDFMLDGNIIALHATGDPGLQNVARGLEAERQYRWEHGGSARAAMADDAAWDIVEYGILLPASIAAAPILFVEGAAIASVEGATSFALLRSTMYMSAGAEMGTAGVNQLATGGQRGIVSSGLNYVTGTGAGNSWGFGDYYATASQLWVGGEAIVGLTRAGISKARSMMPSRAGVSEGGVVAPLQEGVAHETERLAQLGIPKNNMVWRPTQTDFDSAAFQIIVGEPKLTAGGLPRGTIFDGTLGGNLEIKGGSSMLDSSYQLRLQTYRSLQTNSPLTIETTRPVNPTFQSWLDRWGVSVVRPR